MSSMSIGTRHCVTTPLDSHYRSHRSSRCNRVRVYPAPHVRHAQGDSPRGLWDRPLLFADRDAASLERCCERAAGHGPSSGVCPLVREKRFCRPVAQTDDDHRSSRLQGEERLQPGAPSVCAQKACFVRVSIRFHKTLAVACVLRATQAICPRMGSNEPGNLAGQSGGTKRTSGAANCLAHEWRKSLGSRSEGHHHSPERRRDLGMRALAAESCGPAPVRMGLGSVNDGLLFWQAL
ncbi:hypothetical protein OH77DRAFT_710264 [Trametes cingulata]|nr:hypothetical protein OH77DRAFT_710264 [Trametes cingulata]